MSNSETAQYHTITKIPRPFSFDFTPYKETDFSETVKNACSSLSSAINDLRMCKLIIIGDINVGKTSIVQKFTRQCFSFNYKATIGVDFQIEQFNILKVPFSMQIWDTAGQERFKCIAAAYYRRSHVIIAVFDLTNMKSLHHSLDWLSEALRENVSTPLKFLVGSKLDLLKNRNGSKISVEASKIAQSIGAEYWEVSSRTGENIKELFFRVAALSFERIANLELEHTEPCNRLKIGQKFQGSVSKRESLDGKKSKGREKKNFSCSI